MRSIKRNKTNKTKLKSRKALKIRSNKKNTEQNTEQNIIKFVRKLSKLTGPSCFDSGVFIIEINPVVKLFIDSMLKESKKRQISKTHRGFLQKKDTEELIKQHEYIFTNKLTNICNKMSEPKGVILFYTFRHNDKSYLFFKLEKNKAISAEHASDAFKFYILKSKDSKNKSTKPRRETDKTISGLSKILRKDNKLYMKIINKYKMEQKLEDIINDIEYYNEFVRIGHEFFVPSQIAEIIIN